MDFVSIYLQKYLTLKHKLVAVICLINHMHFLHEDDKLLIICITAWLSQKMLTHLFAKYLENSDIATAVAQFNVVWAPPLMKPFVLKFVHRAEFFVKFLFSE